jgi:hypothetical protein
MEHVNLEIAKCNDMGQVVKIASEAGENILRALFFIEPEIRALHRRDEWTVCLRASVVAVE